MRDDDRNARNLQGQDFGQTSDVEGACKGESLGPRPFVFRAKELGQFRVGTVLRNSFESGQFRAGVFIKPPSWDRLELGQFRVGTVSSRDSIVWGQLRWPRRRCGAWSSEWRVGVFIKPPSLSQERP